ncbi:hypothetical protein FO519_010733, partial [Halicephalobus sp. NKZ332]
LLAVVPTAFLANPDDLSNAVGTPCAANVTNAWLDIVLVIDVSDGMNITDLQELGTQLADMFKNFTIGQNPRHSSRVAIVAYAADVGYIYNWTDVTNYADLEHELLKLYTYNTGTSATNLHNSLRATADILSRQSSYRPQAIIIAASRYDQTGFNYAGDIAKALMLDGIDFVTCRLLDIAIKVMIQIL